jgi:acetoin utilization deacetylase AcuC-like enzyme
MTAVDIAMSSMSEDRKDRILVLGRPPGHHAGANGCVVSDYYWRRPDMSSSGFCLLNTVAVAAAYARCKYGSVMESGGTACKRAPKIAIVDFDIHHGNGTEDIIRNLRPRSIHLPLPSSWAPVQRSIYKPWLNEQDAEEVLFASINLVAGKCSVHACH